MTKVLSFTVYMSDLGSKHNPSGQVQSPTQ